MELPRSRSPEDTETLSVSALHAEIVAALSARMPKEVWVRGEVQGKKQSAAGHVYLDLVERRGPGSSVAASIKVMANARDLGTIRRACQTHGVSIDDGVEVRVRGRVSTYAPSGMMQLQMTGIDAAWTLGRLVASRDEVLKKLVKEGVAGRNQALLLPTMPLRVALVTSDGSAAHADFTDELVRSGYAFQVLCCDSRVQGEGAPKSLRAALGRFTQMRGGGWEPDVVVLVRGGGSRTDLSAFDDEELARTITQMPWPVLTGIGHETDRSVCDDVAHTAHKTPTAAAQALVHQVRTRAAADAETYAQVLRVAERALEQAAAQSRHAAAAVGRSAQGRLERAEERLQAGTNRIARGAVVTLEHAAETTERAAAALPGAATRRLGALEATLNAHAGVVRASDPARILARGYSITRREDGTLVRSATDAPAGTVLTTETHDGTITSHVREQEEPDGA